jgi:hypothetical protein
MKKKMENLTKTIFATFSYPDFGKAKGSYINVIASTYFVGYNEHQDYNVHFLFHYFVLIYIRSLYIL